MKKRSKLLIATLSFLICFLSTVPVVSSSHEDSALKGLKSVKAVFDFRHGNPQTASLFLDLIHETYKGKDVASVTKKPEFVFVFLGPAVKLISKNREGLSPEDSKMYDAIAGKISEMAKDGIKLEICMFAAKLFKVDPESILPEIKQTDNGLPSLIGYQAKGYSLVPIY